MGYLATQSASPGLVSISTTLASIHNKSGTIFAVWRSDSQLFFQVPLSLHLASSSSYSGTPQPVP